MLTIWTEKNLETMSTTNQKYLSTKGYFLRILVNISTYYNLIISNLFIPRITLPTRITSHSQTLIDNIFSNDPNFSQCIFLHFW